MSVVGPRPALPNEVATYNDYQRQRLLVKPGMTCYWQTRRNRDSITFDEWVDLDLWRARRIHHRPALREEAPRSAKGAERHVLEARVGAGRGPSGLRRSGLLRLRAKVKAPLPHGRFPVFQRRLLPGVLRRELRIVSVNIFWDCGGNPGSKENQEGGVVKVSWTEEQASSGNISRWVARGVVVD